MYIKVIKKKNIHANITYCYAKNLGRRKIEDMNEFTFSRGR